MKYILILLLSLTLTIAQSERYIVAYNNQAWTSSQRQRRSSTTGINTVRVFNELKMHVVDLDARGIRTLSATPGVTLYKNTQVSQVRNRTRLQKNPPSWGLDRIDQRKLPLDYLYRYSSKGSGVDVWVIDTGIQVDHVEFEGRATFDKNFVGDGIDTDCAGHGTHVASTIGGKNVGVAKGVRLHALKVLDCEGDGEWENLLAAIDYVIAQHKSVAGSKSVINLSLGGEKFVPADQAVQVAVQAGIVVSIASGNDNIDACTVSPVAPGAIMVAATNMIDQSTWFTNWGTCITLYAPGEDIVGAYIGEVDDNYAILAGTSMAAPHVSGAAALLLSSGLCDSPASVKDYLINKGTPNVLHNVIPSTPNILLYTWK